MLTQVAEKLSLVKGFDNVDVIMLIHSLRNKDWEESSSEVEEFYTKYQHLIDCDKIDLPKKSFIDYKTFNSLPFYQKDFLFDTSYRLPVETQQLLPYEQYGGLLYSPLNKAATTVKLCNFVLFVKFGVLTLKLKSLTDTYSEIVKLSETDDQVRDIDVDIVENVTQFTLTDNDIELRARGRSYEEINLTVEAKLAVKWNLTDNSISVSVKEVNFKDVYVPPDVKQQLFGTQPLDFKLKGYTVKIAVSEISKK